MAIDSVLGVFCIVVPSRRELVQEYRGQAVPVDRDALQWFRQQGGSSLESGELLVSGSVISPLRSNSGSKGRDVQLRMRSLFFSSCGSSKKSIHSLFTSSTRLSGIPVFLM